MSERRERTFLFTSESVTEGHPDKVCDYIADSILDAHLAINPKARVACEVLAKDDLVVVAGEFTEPGAIDTEAVVRAAIREIGYVDSVEPFNSDGVRVQLQLSKQSQEIKEGVDEDPGHAKEQGAGDQGIMFGYATDETPERMPLPILLAHRLAKGLTDDRKSGRVPWLRPDGKTQVTAAYSETGPVEVTDVVVSTQHRDSTSQEEIRLYVASDLAPRVLGRWMRSGIRFIVNPSGGFVLGGPSADCGVTGRKTVVDGYGGPARQGGGAFSGKDPSKVDRSAAYFCRLVARRIVNEGLAKRAELQVSYAIGQARPVSIHVDTFGTGDAAKAEALARTFDFSPAAMIRTLGLEAPIYRGTTNYGHFGRPGLAWES